MLHTPRTVWLSSERRRLATAGRGERTPRREAAYTVAERSPFADTTEPRRGLAGAFSTRWRAIVEGLGAMDEPAHGLTGIE